MSDELGKTEKTDAVQQRLSK
uniref:Uncharacterized protein n=1 Tax=Arundo donax TaxID=35708 RepID=A0A0A8Y3L2_ARUDO